MESRVLQRRTRFGLTLFLAVVWSCALAGGAAAEWVSLGGAAGAEVDVQVTESSPDRIVLEYTLPGFHADPVEIDGATYYKITLPGESSLLEEGLAELPHVCRSVIIPDQAAMEASVLSADVETFAGLPVIPSKGNLLRTVDPADVPYRFDAQYEAAGWYPPQMVSVGEPYILRDYRGLVVEALPFQFDGAEGTLQVARRMTIELRANGTDLTNSFDRFGPPEKVVRGFLDLYRHHFLNWGMDRYTPVPEEGSMLVITYDAFHSA
ncbi:MAG: hypothetical protein GF355_11405, partial [Candidatus Eisenbacteria bacterium]|nr:hypothetical protein [Candidatus Eisenbacteria bacterium]